MRTFLTCLLAVISISLFAQSVDPLTGRAIVGIPLGSIKAYDLGVSVTLNHSGGALRVDEGAGNAGMGWNVDVGGYSIYREVRGLPDDLNGAVNKGWLYNHTPGYNDSTIQTYAPVANDDLSNCLDEPADWDFINGFGLSKDTEPDVFFFSAPGISGSFVFGSDLLPKLIPYQDIAITFASGNFTIKTNTGLTYTFDKKRTTTRAANEYNNFDPKYFQTFYNQYHLSGQTFTSTWDLSTIQSSATNEQITYTYAVETGKMSPTYVKTVNQSTSAFTGDPVTQYTISDEVSYSRLTNISLKSYDIDFTWANGLIRNIVIGETTSADAKTFEFIYKSVKANVGTPTAWRPFLVQLYQQRDCSYFPPYEFSYIDVNLSTSLADISWGSEDGQDHFGYYNGNYGNLNVPTIYYYSSESGARRFRVTPIPSTSATLTLPGTSTGSRNVNATYAQRGALQTITYPTGGFTTFNYEGNTYWDSSTSEQLPGPGIRVASVISGGGEETFGNTTAPSTTQFHTTKKSYEYKLTDGGNSSGKLLYPSVFAFMNNSDGTIIRSLNDLGPGSRLMYSRVKEIENGKAATTYGSTVYTFYIPDEYPATSTTVPLTKMARKPSTACVVNNSMNGIYTYPFAPAKDINFKRGLLRKVIQYDATGKLLSQRSLAYTQPQASSVVRGLKFENYTFSTSPLNFNLFYYSFYDIPVNQSSILIKERSTTVADTGAADSVSVVSNYTYNPNNSLSQTKQTGQDGSISISNLKYASDYLITSPASGDVAAAGIKKLNTTSRSSAVIENWQTFTPIGSVTPITTGASLNLYKDNGTFALLDKSNVLPNGSTFVASSVATGATQGFSYDSDYITTTTFGYEGSVPVNKVDLSTIPTGIHYATSTGLPVASFVNCSAENAVYEGFEFTTSHGLTGGVINAPSRTGEKAGNLDGTGGSKFASGTVTKLGDSYRVSFWARAVSTGATITINAKNTGGTVQSTFNLLYSGPADKWQYLEGFLNTTSVSSSFTIEVASNLAIRIDDFIALPASARVSSSTFLPLVGQTSTTDDRGNSSITVYDEKGRLTETYDRNRNLTSVTEYNSKIPDTEQLQAWFTSNKLFYETGTSTTFVAGPNMCVPGATYSWVFKPQYGITLTGSGSTVTKTFASIGEWEITLTVSKVGYTTRSYTEKICVGGTYSSQIDLSGNDAWDCNDPEDDGNRTYHVDRVSIEGNTVSLSDVTYDWHAYDDSGNPVGGGSGSSGNSFPVSNPNVHYTVTCVVKGMLNSLQCGPLEITASGSISMSYPQGPECQ
jgi:hypothetical protein